MALPEIFVNVRARVGDALKGLDDLEDALRVTGDTAEETKRKTDRLGDTMRRNTGRSSAFGRGIQNASFQIGDFATQVGAGTNASIALGQQLPQLLGGFGILGAVIGAVVAIGVPLTRVFKGMSDQGRDLSSVLGTLQPVAESISIAFGKIAQFGVQMAEVIINNLDRILITGGVVATFFAGKWVGAFVAARVATFNLAGALVTLRGALIRTGIGALVVGAGELVYQFTRLVSAAGTVGEAIGLMFQVGKEAFVNLGTTARGLLFIMEGAASGIAAAFVDAFAWILEKWDALVNAIRQPFNDLMGGMGLDARIGESTAGSNMRGVADSLEAEGVRKIGVGGGLLNQAMPSLQKIRDLMKGMKDENITLSSILGVGGGEDGEGGNGKSSQEKLDEELSAQEDRIKAHFDRIKALTKGSLSDKLGAWGSYFSNLVSLTGSNNEKLLGIAKSFAAAQALIDAWQAYNRVLKDPSLPWFARIPAAASVLAAGIGAVNAIRSVGSGGSGGAAAGGAGAGGGGQQAQAPERAQRPQVSLNLVGDNFSRAQIVQIAEALNDSEDEGQQLVQIRGRR